MRLDCDSHEFDGRFVDMVIEPGILAWGNERGENYDQHKVWSPATVWIAPEPLAAQPRIEVATSTVFRGQKRKQDSLDEEHCDPSATAFKASSQKLNPGAKQSKIAPPSQPQRDQFRSHSAIKDFNDEDDTAERPKARTRAQEKARQTGGKASIPPTAIEGSFMKHYNSIGGEDALDRRQRDSQQNPGQVAKKAGGPPCAGKKVRNLCFCPFFEL
jgi:hypothetical protein